MRSDSTVLNIKQYESQDKTIALSRYRVSQKTHIQSHDMSTLALLQCPASNYPQLKFSFGVASRNNIIQISLEDEQVLKS